MQGNKIIIFEDEFLAANDLKKQLIKLGYQVFDMFATAEQGLMYLEENHGTENFPDAVVMDITLKGDLDGIEAAAIIHEKYVCGVLFLTGLGQIEVIEQIFKQKPVPFLIKPFDVYLVHIGLQLAMYQAKLEKTIKDLRKEQEKN